MECAVNITTDDQTLEPHPHDPASCDNWAEWVTDELYYQDHYDLDGRRRDF